MKILAGGGRDLLALGPTKTGLRRKFHCLLNLLLTNLEWPASFCCLPLLSVDGDQFVNNFQALAENHEFVPRTASETRGDRGLGGDKGNLSHSCLHPGPLRAHHRAWHREGWRRDDLLPGWERPLHSPLSPTLPPQSAFHPTGPPLGLPECTSLLVLPPSVDALFRLAFSSLRGSRPPAAPGLDGPYSL